jgi:hypothetical protein
MTMSYRFTRRKFLEAAVAGSALIGANANGEQAPRQAASTALDPAQREALRAAMDEIIPPGDGMPSASAAGGLEYLDRVCRQEAAIRVDLQQALDALGQMSETSFHAPFTGISPAQRVEILTRLETQSPEVFTKLRDLVYESYYTQPDVWKLIGYELHPTNGRGPHMMPFDDSVLAKVRTMPKLYREVEQG